MRAPLPLAATAALPTFILTSSPSCALTGGPLPAAPAAPFYSVVKDDNGVWWFQGPDGSRFYSLGVNNIEPEPFMPRPGSDYYNPLPTEFNGDTHAWASFVRNLLTELGFNTVGAWSSTVLPTDERFVATPILYVVLHDDTRCLAPLQPDFESFVQQNVKESIAKLPGVLVLGSRFAGDAPDSVIRAAGKYCDVISVSDFRFVPKADENTLARFWLLGGRPLMHVDFSFRARANASGNLNTYGVGPVFDTQADRAAAYAALVSDTATVPYVIGSHWFGFADQSPQGRFDGEDGNYGIVDIRNQPYPEMVAAMKATNARVPALHASTKRVMPTELRPRMAASYSPGQHPERPPTLGLLGDWVAPPETWAAPAGSTCRPCATSGWSSRACPRPGRWSSTGWSSSGSPVDLGRGWPRSSALRSRARSTVNRRRADSSIRST
jgi:hypothetical protein